MNKKYLIYILFAILVFITLFSTIIQNANNNKNYKDMHKTIDSLSKELDNSIIKSDSFNKIIDNLDVKIRENRKTIVINKITYEKDSIYINNNIIAMDSFLSAELFIRSQYSRK